MQPGVARFDSEPPDTGDPPTEPFGSVFSQSAQEPLVPEAMRHPIAAPARDPAAVAPPVPEPIEPGRTEAVRRTTRWRGAPPWLPALALLFAGVCGIAALLYWLWLL
jgi:hypothetical protein